jgi:putative nucleotidyltransferase with HDIG domain
MLGDKGSLDFGGVLLVDADLRKMARVEQIKETLKEMHAVSEKLFVVQQHLHHMVAQAYALGATSVVRCNREIGPRIAQIEAAAKASGTRIPEGRFSGINAETIDCAKVFASMFAVAKQGKSIDFAEAEHATSHVITGIERDGLTVWLDNVRRYHEGTFQHCLLVTGVAVGFAVECGFAAVDVKRLGIAATLHDIGKAQIPISILDKPGRLDPTEQEVMKRHPLIGYELLKDVPSINAEILDGVRHHHEYLDGSGYPDALKGSQISDLVRLLTISDVFAALIESRSYRPPMPRQDAYGVLCDMGGKLEPQLVKAFRKVALAT